MLEWSNDDNEKGFMLVLRTEIDRIEGAIAVFGAGLSMKALSKRVSRIFEGENMYFVRAIFSDTFYLLFLCFISSFQLSFEFYIQVFIPFVTC